MRLPDIRISPFLFPYLAAVWIFLPRGACSALILAAALHEIGHLLCLYILGLRPSRLCIQIGGAIIEANCSTLSYGREAWVYIAGPLANLATILPCLLTTSRFAIQLAAASALCAGYNLLPILPLDGGQVLFCLCASRLPPARAYSICKKSSTLCTSIALFWATCLLLRSLALPPVATLGAASFFFGSLFLFFFTIYPQKTKSLKDKKRILKKNAY